MRKTTVAMIGWAAASLAPTLAPADRPWTSAAQAQGMPGTETFEMPAPPPPPGPHGPGMMGVVAGGPMLPMPLLLRELNEEQRRQAFALFASERDELRPLLEQLQDASEALADKLLAPDTDAPTDLAAEVAQVNLLRQKLLERELTTALAVRSLMSEQQLTSAAERLKKLRALAAPMEDTLIWQADE